MEEETKETASSEENNSPQKKSDETSSPISLSKNAVIIALIFLVLILGGYSFYQTMIQNKVNASPTPQATASEEAEETLSPQATTLLSPTPFKTPAPTPTPQTPTPAPTPSPMADLYISNYVFNHPPKQGEAFTVSVTIYNQGNSSSGDFWWEWWATTSAPSYACRERVSSLPARGGRVVSCTYTYGGWANYTTKAIADVNNEVNESNESNNTYEEKVVPIH